MSHIVHGFIEIFALFLLWRVFVAQKQAEREAAYYRDLLMINGIEVEDDEDEQ